MKPTTPTPAVLTETEQLNQELASLTQTLRDAHPDFTQALERRLLLLFALRQGRTALEAMVSESMISKEVYTWVDQELGRAWQLGVARPSLTWTWNCTVWQLCWLMI